MGEKTRTLGTTARAIGVACAITVAMSVSFATNAVSVAQQMKRRMPAPPPSAQDDTDKNNPGKLDPQSVKKLQLAQNEKQFREGVERLYQLTGELREEVQQTPTASVLSVRMVKKTDEIEKLAKQLKNKAKGE
jgi:hypothetical protein